MKISGFTFCRNAIKYDYPIIESIRSILPMVDEYIVNVGNSEDDTVKLIRSIGGEKIKIIESVWDEDMKRDGLIYSVQTNIAKEHCTGDWAFYLQADEVVHEDDLETVYKVMKENLSNKDILGLMFRYLHFKGDYWSLDPWMYHKEIRIIRNNGKVRSHGDATGFCCIEDNPVRNLKNGSKMRWVPSMGRIFHYGWVKDPKVMTAKKRYQISLYHEGRVPENERVFFENDEYSFDKYDILKEFDGTHPKVMEDRIKSEKRLRPRHNRWLNWRFYKEVLTHGFKG